MNTTAYLIQALSVASDAAGVPPEIQYMPPGTHTISATKDGKPSKMSVTVNAATVDRLNASLTTLRGQGHEPFIDFNHDDKNAAGWLESFSWGGDDAKTGGVRAKINWSGSGKAAVESRDYRKFSPTFLLSKDGQIVGTDVNAGGLVNRPAFTSIAPVMARSAQPSDTPNTMTPEQELADVKAKLLAAETKAANLEEAAKVSAKANAESIVNAAIADGRIPAKNEALKAGWIEVITVNAKSASLLQAIAPNAALSQVIRAKTGDSGKAPEGVIDAADAASKIDAEVAKVRASHSVSFTEAYNIVRANSPELFEAAASEL